MKQSLNIGKEPNLQTIVIASAVLHVLLIAFLSVPIRAKEQAYKNYFVDLVSSTELQGTPDNTSPEKPLTVSKDDVKAGPVNNQKTEKAQLSSAISGDNNILKKSFEVQRETASGLLSRTENNTITAKKEIEIIRDAQETKGRYNQGHVPITNGYIGTTAALKNELQEQQFIIARKNVPAQTEAVFKEPGAGFHERSVIDFKSNEQGGFPDQRDSTEKIERPGLPGKDEELIINTGSGGARSASGSNGFLTSGISIKGGSSEQTAGSGSIERPGLQSGPTGGTNAYNKLDAQLIKSSDAGKNKARSGKNEAFAPELSIQGVALDDLIACTNALDEGTLKKRILNIIGYKKECYNPSTGKFAFIGTDRYTSFGMLISPVSGRKLLNRCEELKNALSCLNQ